jgi:hypothetical protein
MSKEPKEVRDIVREFKRALLAVRELHGRAMEIGIKDIEAAAEVAHDACSLVPAIETLPSPEGSGSICAVIGNRSWRASPQSFKLCVRNQE